MDVRIGITQTAQVIELELAEDTDGDAVRAQIDGVLAAGEGVLWLTDRKGKQVAIPSARISFVELKSSDAERRIGFGA